MFEVAAQLHVDKVATYALLQWSDACGLRPELCATYAPLPVSDVGQTRPEHCTWEMFVSCAQTRKVERGQSFLVLPHNVCGLRPEH